jgi:hypothetical protein
MKMNLNESSSTGEMLLGLKNGKLVAFAPLAKKLSQQIDQQSNAQREDNIVTLTIHGELRTNKMKLTNRQQEKQNDHFCYEWRHLHKRKNVSNKQ